MNITITGVTGFVGSAIVERLSKDTSKCLISVSRSKVIFSNKTEKLGKDLADTTDWSDVLHTCDVVIHSAARVHVMNDTEKDPLQAFRAVNVDGTLYLAHQAAQAGVKRFIFISSIKVNGEGTGMGKPYTAFDMPAPQDPYGISKMEAEHGLREIAKATGMEVVIIRPVLVYGPGVKANFLSMMSWLNKGVPLPLGAIHNKRSLVSLDNLVDLIVTCIDHPSAANETFLVSDGEDLSTTEMLRRMGQALGKKARLVPVPAGLLEAGAAMLGKRAVAQRLCGSLQVDIRHTRETLNWNPPVSVDDGFRAAASAFLKE